jgi:uncharacterized protein (DUF927 family)
MMYLVRDLLIALVGAASFGVMIYAGYSAIKTLLENAADSKPARR